MVASVATYVRYILDPPYIYKQNLCLGTKEEKSLKSISLHSGWLLLQQECDVMLYNFGLVCSFEMEKVRLLLTKAG